MEDKTEIGIVALGSGVRMPDLGAKYIVDISKQEVQVAVDWKKAGKAPVLYDIAFVVCPPGCVRYQVGCVPIGQLASSVHLSDAMYTRIQSMPSSGI